MNRVGLGASAVLLAALALGCGRHATEPILGSMPANEALESNSRLESESSRHGFYPLAIGNRWTYEAVSSKSFAFAQGDTFSKHSHRRTEVRLVGHEVLDGRAYFREDVTTYEASQKNESAAWLRQDAFGLYQPGINSLESQVLRYPLHIGQTWIVSPVPGDTALVVGREIVQTPIGRSPAWMIRIRYRGRHPGDEVFMWYGDLGYLGLKRHFEQAFDGPNPGTFTEDQSEWLVSVDLSDR